MVSAAAVPDVSPSRQWLSGPSALTAAEYPGGGGGGGGGVAVNDAVVLFAASAVNVQL
jgi:hypothetical protein